MEGNLVGERIFVDHWIPYEEKSCAYFMTVFRPEFHKLLDNSWKFPIYSSELNIQTLKCFTEVKHELLHSLKFNTKEFISLEDYNFYVVAIDSESLTGSVIYHFICPNSEYLYLGKIRISPEVLKNSYIAELGAGRSISGLFVDTTLLGFKTNFTLEQAVNSVIKIIKHYSESKFVLALPSCGYDDLLMEIASNGIAIFPGSYRLQFYKIQGIHKHFSESRRAMLRVVSMIHCLNMEDAKRRLHEQKLLTLMPSAVIAAEEMESLRSSGIHIIHFADNTTIRCLVDLLKIVKPLHLHSIQKNASSALFEPLVPFLRTQDNTSLINPALDFSPDRENLHKSISAIDESGTSSSLVQLVHDLTHFEELTPESGLPNIFQKDERRNTGGIFTKNKNIDHLITDTQSSFHPLATSTQQNEPDPEISDDLSTVHSTQSSVASEIPPSQNIPTSQNIPPSQNILTSQRNMNRFDEEYVNDPLNRKNKLNRLHLHNIFGMNSMNRAASISKAKRTVEVSCQTDLPLVDINLPENVIQEVTPIRETCEGGDSLGTQTHLSFVEPRRKRVAFNSDLNIIHEMNDSFPNPEEVVSETDHSTETDDSYVYPATAGRDMLNETLSEDLQHQMEIEEQDQNIPGIIRNNKPLSQGDSVEITEEICKAQVHLPPPSSNSESQGSSVVIVDMEVLPVTHVELTCSSEDLHNILNSTAGSAPPVDPLMCSFEHVNDFMQCSPVTVEIPPGPENSQKAESDLEKGSQLSYYTRISQVNYDDELFSDDEEEDDDDASVMTCVINTKNSSGKNPEDGYDLETVNGEELAEVMEVIPSGNCPELLNVTCESNVSESSVSTIDVPVFVHLNKENQEESQIIHSVHDEVRTPEHSEDLDIILIESDSTQPVENIEDVQNVQKPSSKRISLQQQSILQHFKTRTPISEQVTPQKSFSIDSPLHIPESLQSSLRLSSANESLGRNNQVNLEQAASTSYSSFHEGLSLPSTSKGFSLQSESLGTMRSTSSTIDSFKSLTIPCYISIERLSEETISEFQKEEFVLTDRQKLRVQYNEEKSKLLEQFAVPELETFHTPHIFSKKMLQFLDDNFLEPKKLSMDMQRFRYANMLRNLDHVEKTNAEQSKNKGKGKGKNGGKGRKKGG